jgi:dCMP deaminase
MRLTWHEYFKNLCEAIALRSPDASTKVGCVIIGKDRTIRSTGYNGFISGAKDTIKEGQDPSCFERPYKYLVTIHAEQNAIASAAKRGIALDNCELYVSEFPCSDCTKLIIQAGIKKICVCNKPSLEFSERWKEHIKASYDLLSCSNCELIFTEDGEDNVGQKTPK